MGSMVFYGTCPVFGSLPLLLKVCNPNVGQLSFKDNLTRIITILIEQDIIPILATKADNLEDDHQINMIIAELAVEYEIPLWNFWLAVQPLPNHGLQSDGAHLTWGKNYFDSSETMENAWPWRNLTALQMLNKLYSDIFK